MRSRRAAAEVLATSPPAAARRPKVGLRADGSPAKTRSSRGRPRNPSIHREVVAAVLSTLRDGGYAAVTLDGIARKVKRARTSLYRRWPSKRHLVVYTVVSEMGASPAADTGTLRGDLRAVVGTLLRAFAGPLRQALPGLVAEMAHDGELADTLRSEVLGPRRSSMRAAFARAKARREVRSDLEIDLLLDMLTGPFYYRALFGHAPISRRMAHDVVEYVLRIAVRE
jgi:AcrR family transcriptional regulator